MKDRIKKALAAWLRRLSSRLDKAHLVVVAENANGQTMAAYLAALARKKDFEAWTVAGWAARRSKSVGRSVRASQ